MLYVDCEVYPNVALVMTLDDNDNVTQFTHSSDAPMSGKDARNLHDHLRSDTIVTFNGNNYDRFIMSAVVELWDTKDIYKLSKNIVESGGAQDCAFHRHLDIDHIDLFRVSPGMASLKTYAGRLGCKVLQDLPYDPHKPLNSAQIRRLARYCTYDLHDTKTLYMALKSDVDMRFKMGEQYGVDMRSLGAAQVAKLAIQKEMESNGSYVSNPDKRTSNIVRYIVPEYIRFEDKNLSKLLDKIADTKFSIKDSGHVELPSEISKPILLHGASYKMGIGGLHSQEERQSIHAGPGMLLFDMDVASMYPNIITTNHIEPSHLPPGAFLGVYQNMLDRRLTAKHEGDKHTSDALKLILNSTFGQFANRYTYLYDPQCALQVTITGQLCLLMLIESISQAGGKVVSANTDGVVVHCKEKVYDDVCAAAFMWEMYTGLELEETSYVSIHMLNVNNYVAVKGDLSTKTKGCFAGVTLDKNPAMPIVYEAVAKFLSTSDSPENTIKKCRDINKFVTVRKVKGGAQFEDEYLGKVVRFYWSSSSHSAIVYSNNGNKVPKSDNSNPVMSLPDDLPDDLDHKRYIKETYEVIRCLKSQLKML